MTPNRNATTFFKEVYLGSLLDNKNAQFDSLPGALPLDPLGVVPPESPYRLIHCRHIFNDHFSRTTWVNQH